LQEVPAVKEFVLPQDVVASVSMVIEQAGIGPIRQGPDEISGHGVQAVEVQDESFQGIGLFHRYGKDAARNGAAPIGEVA
jgi:hypothetical protein